MHLSKLLRGFVLLFGLFVVTTTAFGEELKATSKAREHFNAGLAHVDDPAGPKYEEAYREFKAAYAETPSYEIALNVGYCAFFLERDAEALEMYQIFLAKADMKDVPKKKRVQMEKDIQSLRSGLVKVEIKVTPSKATVVDERFPAKGANIVNRYPIESGVAQLGLHPGTHKVTITAEGYQSQSWEFEAQPASTHAHEFKLIAVDADKPAADKAATAGPAAPAVQAGATAGSSLDSTAPAQTKKSTSPMVYVGAIATGVFVAGAVTTGLIASSKKSDFEAANDGTQYSTAEGLRSDAKTLALVSDICIGAAVLSAGVTTYFIFAGGSSAPAPAQKAQWKLAPAIGGKQAGLAVTGSF